ncbi:helix-turn-helix domain-containing protein [Mucilaginibacter myungsuensis]|uniref:Helix-turn-helix transcriptional regulator n=1 Tax=Mucilaginibacter myungsuensis TaxID=649104 RepID=A0A929PYQ8_9SPHI|nr:AraC family transcriptional regulator [Mucilaginibacter myungsuensis]MBE9663710.1 helix-turn-helix transcriptional regulator [Mucilaginibacter myungsuensis]MDN3598966.1 AraC family transcriptional regulator [Mucilaginibacter myungsuensis]
MTHSGELTTLNGVLPQETDSVFGFNRAIAMSYAMNAKDGSVQISMSHPDERQTDVYQMIFVLKGKLRLQRPGQTGSLGKIDAYQHNLFRTKLKSTCLKMSSITDDVICINLSGSFLKRYLPIGHPANQRLTHLETTLAPTLSAANMPITPEIAAILQSLGNSQHGGFCDQLLLESKVIELLALQLSIFEQLRSTVPSYLPENEVAERMHKVKDILIDHTGSQLSLRDLAHMVFSNEFNLKRDFKAVFGNTVYGYLKDHKMEQAKTMLIGNNITIDEVSKKLGYKHATHFTSAFKKHFGYLPNKIRGGKLT